MSNCFVEPKNQLFESIKPSIEKLNKQVNVTRVSQVS